VKPNLAFRNQPKSFWAYVRTISQQIGYTRKALSSETSSQVLIPSVNQICDGLIELGLDANKIKTQQGEPTALGSMLLAYFQHRANVLNGEVQLQLMNAEQAKAEYEELLKKRTYTCPLPLNKQKGLMKAPAFLTGMVNMLIEANLVQETCDYDPRTLTTVTVDDSPVRTLARRVDGAFPSAVNPVAIWEIKEYYYTTSFGSRIADGVYETLLDGMELEELQQSENIEVKHYLMIDGYKTWWVDGKSYLCRIVDMVHMGYVDEVLVGREVLDHLPSIVKSWLKINEQRKPKLSLQFGEE
jgi:hypothetical protein